MKIRNIIYASMILLTFTGCAPTLKASIPISMPTIETTAPEGYLAYCNRHPGDNLCEGKTVPAPAGERKFNVADLVGLNDDINYYPYMDDYDNWFMADFWEDIRKRGRGDCEDYAIAKFKILLEMGWPKEKMHFATCFTKKDRSVSHAVLIVETDQGAYVLDMGNTKPIPFNEYPHEWHKFQINGKTWATFKTFEWPY
jgi:predicted transglutaminase-like cysteine proteinase